MVNIIKAFRPAQKRGYRPPRLFLMFCSIFAISTILPSTGLAANSLSQFGITWTFDKDYTVGQFANGDYWVVGPVTIIGIDPPSVVDATGRTINGAMLNPVGSTVPKRVASQGFDSTTGAYNSSLNIGRPNGNDLSVGNPLIIEPDHSLVSAISSATAGAILTDAAVLTILGSAPPAGSFRPPYAGTDKTIKFNVNDLDYSSLGSLVPVSSAPDLATAERWFERPWLDFQYAWGLNHPSNNMPDYGVRVANAIGLGALVLNLDYTNAQKETLMIRYVQLGIDLYGVLISDGRLTWWANGGHSGGRKLPILFAGMALNDPDIKGIGSKSGDYLYQGGYGPGNPPPDYYHFGEDDQTFYVKNDDIYPQPYTLYYKSGGTTAGNVKVTNGNTIVEGVGTSWLSLGGTLYFGVEDDIEAYTAIGQDAYTIASIDSDTQITLNKTYRGATDQTGNANYAIASFVWYGHAGPGKYQEYDEFRNVDLNLPSWGIVHAENPSVDGHWGGKAYQGTMGKAFCSLVLPAHIMGLKGLWNHNAYFDYTDRYMELTVGQSNRSMSQFAEDMWDTYRADYGPVWSPDSGNGAPVLQAIGDKSVAENEPLSFIVSATDPEGDPLTYSVENLPFGASFDVNTQEFSWQPAYQDVGIHGVSFSVSDGVYQDTEAITITVDFLDSDLDTLPDTWELLYFGNLAPDPNDDPDNDGLTNLDEYQRGTDPTVYDELPTELVLHLEFDDQPSDGVLDSSTYANHGTSSGGISLTTDRNNNPNSAYLFDGVNGYVNCGSDASIDNIWDGGGTFSIWVYPETISQDSRIFSKGSNTYSNLVIETGSGIIGFRTNSYPGPQTTTGINAREWTHLSLTYDNSGTSQGIKIYFNGIEQPNDSTTPGIINDASNNFIIGSDSGSRRYFHGKVDDLRLYTRALTSQEILDLYNEGTTPNTNAPVLDVIGNKSVNENSALIFDVNATDPDGDPITYSATGSAISAGATFSGQTFSWTPSYDQAGIYSVTFIAKDNNQAQDSETITITVNNVNRPPVIGAIGDQSVNENSILSLSVNASDPDGQALTYSISGLPAGAAFVSRTLTWTPSYDQAGTFGVTFTADDGQAQDSEAITITVINVNRTPVLAAIDNRSVWADDPLTFTIDATDPDGDAVTYSASNLPSSATFTGQDFDWTPSQGQGGSYDVTFIASDGPLQDSQMVTITVDVDSLAPTISNSLPTAGSIQAPLNNLINLNITDAGKGIDADTITIKVNNNTVYTGDTNHYSSPDGECRRLGNKADYRFVYQSNEEFDYDQTMGITVNATDLAGNVMSEHSYSFVTEMRSFSQNKQVNSGSVNLNNDRPVTVRDSSGNIWAAWHAGPIDNRDIYIGKLAAGADDFGSTVQLTTDATDQCNPAVALDSSDNLYVVWQDNREGDWDIYVSTSVDGISWLTETRVNDPNNDNQVNPAIIIDGQSPNQAHVVWQDDRAGNQDICVATSSDGFATKTVSQITSDSFDQVEPAITADSANTIYVVWTDGRNGPNDIYGAASNNPWTNVAIVNNANNQSSPAIAAESAGSILHLLWADDTSGDNDIHYASSNGLLDCPLTDSSIIDDTSGADQLEPAIVIEGSTGNDLKVFACWQDWRNTDTDLYFAELSAGSGTNVFVGDGGSSAYQALPAIGIDEYSHPYLVWADSRNADIYYARSTYVEPVPLISELAPFSSGAVYGLPVGQLRNPGDICMQIPGGAYSHEIRLKTSRIKNAQRFSAKQSKVPYEFGPSGIDFNVPITITIAYVPVGTPVSVYWYNPLLGTLKQDGITNVTIIKKSQDLHLVRFKVRHFTSFYLIGGAGAAAALGLGGGGGGGGCSVCSHGEGNIVEFFLPYFGFVVVLAILTVRDARVRKARNMTTGK